jgi:hypothetical protein
MFEGISVNELMRGSWIEYKEERQLHRDYGKWFKDLVWGFSTDDEQRDVVEVGKFGVRGYLAIDCIRGIDITEDMLLDYGFLLITGLKNIVTYYRDDFGHVKLDTYGLQHIYGKGKPIKYWHNFQRIFYDYTGKILVPKTTKEPVKERELTRTEKQILHPKSNEEIIAALKDAEAKLNISVSKDQPELEF